ncbi:hypothetical protein SDC9_127956 [bioreactor metagenome]|uniref:HTH cro/C1-type domain-containing protein n=1 Tax=bioreactor metagenome TaxID=1076179 RepID=A0A645CVK1_9ZZZZ
MHTISDTLGSVIKNARLHNELTREQLAERLNISPRYLISIENENKKPSYEILFKIIQELAINPDLIFYPDKLTKDSEIEDLVRMIYSCNTHSLQVVRATVKALIDNNSDE